MYYSYHINAVTSVSLKGVFNWGYG